MKRWIICIFICLVGFLGFGKPIFATESNTCKFLRRDFSEQTLGYCKLVEDNCDYKNGMYWSAQWGNNKNKFKNIDDFYASFWNGKEDGCPPCFCFHITEFPEDDPARLKYKKNTCTVNRERQWLFSKYVVPYKLNFCQDSYVPEVTKEGQLFGTAHYCQCRLKTDRPSENAIAFEYEPRPQDSSYKDLIGLKTEYLYGTNYKLYCDGNDKENPRIQTSLGCIPITPKDFITWLLPLLFSVAGSVAFLIMVGGFISLSTSEGDPKKMQAAKDTITAAITGLLISLFAIFIVRFIMAYVLKIPRV